MTKLKYRIIETPDAKHVLAGISLEGQHQVILVSTEPHCKKILKDIEMGHRDALGCKTLVEKEFEVKEKK